MNIHRLVLIISLFFNMASAPVYADVIRPAYLELTEISSDNWDLLWKVPANGSRKLALQVKFPPTCKEGDRGSQFVAAAYVERWRLRCEDGLIGNQVGISGLTSSRTDVLVRIIRDPGMEQLIRLTPSNSTFIIKAEESFFEISTTYLMLGFEHILAGFDHLLFVMALLFLVGNWPRLIGTITTFTVAHSITLAAASIGLVNVPQALVEALIALSIVFVAIEILHSHGGRFGIAARMPWLVAFIFGLLHGFGFAGALSEIGLPQHAIPLALLFFNIGVELGQLTFVMATLGLLYIGKSVIDLSRNKVTIWQLVAATAQPAAYLIGSLAMFWVVERTYNFVV